jgi:hypothetical protein
MSLQQGTVGMPFDFQPTMKGTLVELRPLRPDDADDLFASRQTRSFGNSIPFAIAISPTYLAPSFVSRWSPAAR